MALRTCTVRSSWRCKVNAAAPHEVAGVKRHGQGHARYRRFKSIASQWHPISSPKAERCCSQACVAGSLPGCTASARQRHSAKLFWQVQSKLQSGKPGQATPTPLPQPRKREIPRMKVHDITSRMQLSEGAMAIHCGSDLVVGIAC